MAAINSLLFLLSTIAPNTESPDNHPVTYTTPPEWNNNEVFTPPESKGREDLESCFPIMEVKGYLDCPPHQHFEACASICQEYCIKYDCPFNCCIQGCFCDEGYVRSLNDSCIKKEECAHSGGRFESLQVKGDNDVEPCVPEMSYTGDMDCPANEHYEQCGPVCPEACIEYDCPLNCCVEGCFCDEGFVRGFSGTCIKGGKCFQATYLTEFTETEGSKVRYSKKCGPDEYISCDSQCQRNCSNYHDVFTCSTKCVLGCVCQLPKIRGPEGNCIFPQQCPSLLLANDDIKDAIIMCNLMRIMNPKAPRCPITVEQCNDIDGCSGDGNQNSRLVSPRIRGHDSGKPCFPDIKIEGHMECPKGEHYEMCGTICLETCIEYDCPLTCCVETCFCDEGLVRGPTGDCIPKEQCSNYSNLSVLNRNKGFSTGTAKSCGPDEIVSCDSEYQRNCSNYQDEILSLPGRCVLNCVCKPPKVRGPDGSCILPEECPATSLTKLEKDMSREAMICNFLRIMSNPPEWSKTCSFSMIVKQCNNPEGCSENGNINSLQSPEEFPACPENEFYSLCDAHCQKDCTNYDKKIPCARMCADGCICNPPLIRGPDSDCINVTECPEITILRSAESNVIPVCPENQYYDTCGLSCPTNCTNYDKNITCPSVCVQGCFCQAPLVKSPYGNCVNINDCSRILVVEGTNDSQTHIPECPENEEFFYCGTTCDKNCSNYDQNTPCPFVCEPNCYCVHPLIRGPDGRCIHPSECPAKPDETKDSENKTVSPILRDYCRENEYFSDCRTICPDTCYNNKGGFNFCKLVCLPMCACLPGYVMYKNNTCIKLEDCENERPEDCTEREYFSDCGTYCETDCFNYANLHRKCPDDGCRKGCFCRPGWYRAPDMKCVDLSECPNASIKKRLEESGNYTLAKYFTSWLKGIKGVTDLK